MMTRRGPAFPGAGGARYMPPRYRWCRTSRRRRAQHIHWLGIRAALLVLPMTPKLHGVRPCAAADARRRPRHRHWAARRLGHILFEVVGLPDGMQMALQVHAPGKAVQLRRKSHVAGSLPLQALVKCGEPLEELPMPSYLLRELRTTA